MFPNSPSTLPREQKGIPLSEERGSNKGLEGRCPAKSSKCDRLNKYILSCRESPGCAHMLQVGSGGTQRWLGQGAQQHGKYPGRGG